MPATLLCRIVEELGGECTIQEFIDKYFEKKQSEISIRTVKRKFDQSGIVELRTEGKVKIYGFKKSN